MAALPHVWQAGVLLVVALMALPAARAGERLPTAASATPVVAGAYELALAFLDDVRADRIDAAFAKMERRYRDAASAADLKRGIDAVEAEYGQFLGFQYKTRFDAQRMYPDGLIKPMSKFWFADRTDKRDGVYTSVEVVPDDGAPAVASFSTVIFPDKLPEELR